MLRPTIRNRILGIALGLIVLMAVTSVLSTVMTRRIAHQLDELTTKYVEAYGNLARMNVRSLEQALALRRMVIAKMQSPPDNAGFAERQKVYEAKGLEIHQEAQAARALINAIIDDLSTASDNARLGRIDDRIETVDSDLRRYLSEENARMLAVARSRELLRSQSHSGTGGRAPRRVQPKGRRNPQGHDGPGPRRCRRDDGGPAKGHLHLGNLDRACGDPGAVILTLRRHRHYAAGPAAA